MSRRFLITLAVLLLCLSPALLAAKDKLSLDHYAEMERVANPRISPDGSRIVYTRSWTDKVNDARKSSIWIMNADGSRNRFLIDGSSPKWSPDGTRIAFMDRGEPSGNQIFVRWMDAEGSVTQITRLSDAPGGVEWSPDGNTIAFTMRSPKKNRWPVKMPAKPDGAKWTESPTIVESMAWRRDRVGAIDPGYTHIFVVPAGGGTPRQLTEGDYHHGGGSFGGSSISWTPDGQEILFSGLREDDAEYKWRESEVYGIKVDDGAVRQLTNRKGPDGGPKVSPDGMHVAYTGYDWTDQTYIESKLYVMGIDGSEPREIATSMDRSPGGLIWSEDSRGVYFTANDSGSRNFHYAGLNGDLKAITDGKHMMSVSQIGKQGQAVGIASSPHEPGDIYIFNPMNPQLKQLTFVNDDVLGQVQLGEVEEIWYNSVDDLKIQGWVIKPPDFDASKKYPMMLAIHGGPHGMYNVGFNFGWQEHAANGYVVLYTNPRGSSGYGTDFGNEINRAYPSKDYDDLMAGVDTVLEKGYVDDSNLFVYGCSGGGVLTAWVVGHTDRFAAASSNCPVINWLSFVGTTDGNMHWYRNFEKLPWEDPSEHLRRSPLMYIGNVTTPTMLMTGELDLRTPIAQTEEFYQALKIRRVPTAMVRFKKEFHGTSSKPSNFYRTQLYLRYWFEKYMTDDMKKAHDMAPVDESRPQRE